MMTRLFNSFRTRTASLFRSGRPEDSPVDPFAQAVNLAHAAESKARKGGKVAEMLSASTQWLAIAQIYNEIGGEEEVARPQVGFTGGKNNE